MSQKQRPFKFSAIVLCGGLSERMGYHKFRLPLGERTFLECVVASLLDVVEGPVICVANQDSADLIQQTLQVFSGDRIQVVADQRENAGPLEGIRVGLETATAFSQWAFVSSCDVPMIVPAVVARLQNIADSVDDDIEAIIPCSGQRVFGMTAMYRTDTHSKVDALIERNQLKVSGLASELKSKIIDLNVLREVDPQLDSVRNLNLPSQYLDFLREKGFSCPPEIQQQLSLGPERAVIAKQKK